MKMGRKIRAMVMSGSPVRCDDEDIITQLRNWYTTYHSSAMRFAHEVAPAGIELAASRAKW